MIKRCDTVDFIASQLAGLIEILPSNDNTESKKDRINYTKGNKNKTGDIVVGFASVVRSVDRVSR